MKCSLKLKDENKLVLIVEATKVGTSFLFEAVKTEPAGRNKPFTQEELVGLGEMINMMEVRKYGEMECKKIE